jgi:uncharacterized Fe-S cluster-containing radical SAM superfamily protein
LHTGKFNNPYFTAAGEPRASVALQQLRTLWFNTGTLCNITCRNCYIESSPRNDRLVYLNRTEVLAYLDEIARDGWGTQEIGFTGGEPFLNPDLLLMMADCLSRGFRVLILTNAMRPMQRKKSKLIELNSRFGRDLTVRVSLDHFTPERHEEERGPGTFRPTLEGLIWLARSGFKVAVAGRTMWNDDPQSERAGMPACFRSMEFQSMRTILRRSCSFRKWMRTRTSRKSPRRAGVFSANHHRTSCARARAWWSSARAAPARSSLRAPWCPTMSSLSSAPL